MNENEQTLMEKEYDTIIPDKLASDYVQLKNTELCYRDIVSQNTIGIFSGLVLFFHTELQQLFKDCLRIVHCLRIWDITNKYIQICCDNR